MQPKIFQLVAKVIYLLIFEMTEVFSRTYVSGHAIVTVQTLTDSVKNKQHSKNK